MIKNEVISISAIISENRGLFPTIPEVARGTLRVIIKDAGLTVEELLTLV